MLTNNIKFKNFQIKKKLNTNKILHFLLKENNQVINSLRKKYKDSFNKKKLIHFQKKLDYRIIGMVGSTLGSQAIYDFLKKKINKSFTFVANLNVINSTNIKKHTTNLLISKSCNTNTTVFKSTHLIQHTNKH